MQTYARYAVYYLPAPGPLATFGAQWLGWDVETGADCKLYDEDVLPEATHTPRKYGFHGTLKPPFRLADGKGPDDLRRSVRDLASRTRPGSSGPLALSQLGSFLALTPTGNVTQIAEIAAACVTGLDGFRAPPSEKELARRRAAGLSDRQEALLLDWGYPYVLDEFRFHLTLTGRLTKDQQDPALSAIKRHLPPQSSDFLLNEMALVGERGDGRFELIERFPLLG